MGVCGSEMFVSDHKDVSNSSMEFSFLVRPPAAIPLQFQQQQQEKCEIVELILLSSGEEEEDDDVHENGEIILDINNGGFKTPTSLDHKIPAVLKCPPAPRKPKPLPSPKRKALFRRRILLDLTKEIESLFPAALLADLGNKIKKVRQTSDFK